jgi:hypothetical protein
MRPVHGAWRACSGAAVRKKRSILFHSSACRGARPGGKSPPPPAAASRTAARGCPNPPNPRVPARGATPRGPTPRGAPATRGLRRAPRADREGAAPRTPRGVLPARSVDPAATPHSHFTFRWGRRNHKTLSCRKEDARFPYVFPSKILFSCFCRVQIVSARGTKPYAGVRKLRAAWPWRPGRSPDPHAPPPAVAFAWRCRAYGGGPGASPFPALSLAGFASRFRTRAAWRQDGAQRLYAVRAPAPPATACWEARTRGAWAAALPKRPGAPGRSARGPLGRSGGLGARRGCGNAPGARSAVVNGCGKLQLRVRPSVGS